MCIHDEQLDDLKTKEIVLILKLHSFFACVFGIKWEELLVDFPLWYTIDLDQVKGQELNIAQKNKKLQIWALEMYVMCISLSRIITLYSHDIPLGLNCHVMLFVQRCYTKDYQFYFTISL